MQQQQKEKRGPRMKISIACSLIIGIAIIFLVFSQNKLSNVGQTIADARGNQPEINVTPIDSKFDQIKSYAETYKASHTTYTIEYPEIDDEKFNEAIQQFVNAEKEEFLALAEKNQNVTKQDLNKMSTKLSIDTFNDCFYSFTFHSHTKLGTNNPTEHVSTFVYDSETASVITLEQLLDKNIRYLETFNKYISDQLTSNSELSNALLDKKKLQKVVAPHWDNYSTFAIENDKLIVYFQPGTVAKISQGIVTVSGEMSYLQSILADAFATELTEGTDTLPLIIDNRKRVALTFDDGPHPKVTEQILDILAEFDAKATFFMIGSKVAENPEIVKEIQAGGHEIGNHTWTHPVLTKLSLSEVESEFTKTDKAIFNAIGEHSTIFRAPYGAINDQIKSLLPINSVTWSLDTLDWKHRNAQMTLQIVKANMHNNAVILMHDIHQPTADALRSVLQYLQDEGYEFLTVSEVLPYADFHM